MPIAPILDVVCVLLFVVLGRRTHDEATGLSATIEVATPFVLGLAVAWIGLRAWGRAFDRATGVHVALVTWGLGQVIRRLVFDGGTAIPFLIVSLAFLVSTMVGWRLLVGRFAPRFARGAEH